MTKAIKQPIELKFCDLCGVSIPQKEVDTGAARTIAGKTVGACCLSGLLEGIKTTRPADAAAGAGGGMPLLFATGVILLGILGAAFYLDYKSSARDPAGAIAALDGRMMAMEGATDEQRRVLRTHGDSVVRDVMARVQPALDRLGTEIEKVRGALPKRDAGALDALKARIQNLADQMGDLVARQGGIESELAKSLAAVRAELANVDRSLVDLRRKRAATGGDPEVGADRPRRRVASLPETLGRKVDQLDDGDPGVRWSAVDELIRSRDKRVVPYLLPKLQDADPFVRRLCAEGLAQVGDEEVCGALIKALDDKEAIVRESAFKTLVKLSGQKFAFDPEASDSARKTMVRRWQSWWDGREKARKRG